MPLLFINVKKWVGSLLSLDLLHNFTQINVVCITVWALYLASLNLSFSLKNAIVKIIVVIVEATD